MASTDSTFDINKVAAPLLFGPLVNWGLYGVLCVQTYVYCYNFPEDKRALKILVLFVFLLETVQTALTGADAHFWFIKGFGNYEQLKKSHYVPIDIPLIDCIISFLVQEFFCYRIWTLNKRTLLLPCIAIAITTVIQTAGLAWGGMESLLFRGYVVSKEAYYLWSIPNAIGDILIAVTMVLLLRQTRAVGHFSNYVLLRIVRLAIETNVLTAGVVISSLVLYVAFPNDVYYTFTNRCGILGKLYSNTLLVSLNNRIYFRDHPFRGTQVSQDNSRCPAPTVTVTQISFAQNGLSHATSTSDGSGTESTTDIEKGAVIGDDPNPSK